jgi:hypothetical protein
VELITRDAEALTALALTRRGWSEQDVRAAIADATVCGVGWPTILRDLTRLMTIEDAEPADLVTAHQRDNARLHTPREDTDHA